MKLLEDRIRKDGEVLEGHILKVDSFLNHQLDVPFLNELAQEWKRRFAGCGVTRVLTLEASGIALAVLTAQALGVPAVFAKKAKTSNLSPDGYTSTVHSYTHGTDHTVFLCKKYLLPGDRVLLIDDFLANGESMRALLDLCRQAGALPVGCGVAVEKAFQEGGEKVRKVCRVEALARIAYMDGTTLTFLPDPGQDQE